MSNYFPALAKITQGGRGYSTLVLCVRTTMMYALGVDASTRISRLVETLQLHGRVEVATAAAGLGAAEMTIRRDLEVLVERGVARRVRGGAVNLLMRGEELPFAMRKLDALETKKLIAGAGAGLL